MIKIYTTQIEAYDPEIKELLFIGKTFDEGACEIEIKTLLSDGNVKEVTDAIIEAVKLLCEE